MFDDTAASVIDSFPGAVFVVTRDGRVVTGNDRCSVLFGREFDAFVGDHLRDLVDAGLFAADALDAYQDAAAALSAGERSEAHFEVRTRRAGEGSWYLYEATLTPYRDDGATRGFVWSLTELGTSERYDETVEALHEATRELMAAASRAEAYELCGEAASDVLGFPGTAVREYDPEEELLWHVTFGGRVDDIDSRPPYPVDESPHGRAFRSGETVVDEISEDDPFDRDVFAYTMYVPIEEFGVLSLGKFGDRFDDADRRFAEILAENTAAAIQQVRQREQVVKQRATLRRQNERLDEFASVVAHDLRNPLNLGRGSFQLYRETGDEDAAADVERAFERMAEIIDEVLSLAREGVDLEEMRPVSVGSVAKEAWGSVRSSVASLSVECDATVLADRSRLVQALENLFRNSLEHGLPDTGAEAGDADETEPVDDEGWLTVTVGALEDDAGFFVADDGRGIPEADRDRVFESGYSTADDGTGLGLGIVQRIASAHGWTPSVTASASGGARFEFRVD